MEHILSIVGPWIRDQISALGYAGITALMAIESACIPLPSEIIMPFSGYLVFLGKFNLHFAALAGSLGEAIGSTIAYTAGMRGGRPFIEKYGKYILIRKHDMDRADCVFLKYGEPIVFIGRILPVIRTFISFPAGVARMNYGRFIAYSVAGSILWCYFLVYVGKVLGENWTKLRTYFHGGDVVIVGLVGLAFVVWLIHHLRPEKQSSVKCVSNKRE